MIHLPIAAVTKGQLVWRALHVKSYLHFDNEPGLQWPIQIAKDSTVPIDDSFGPDVVNHF